MQQKQLPFSVQVSQKGICIRYKLIAGTDVFLGTTVYRALRTSDLSPGQWIAIVGAGGGLGHL